MTDRSDSSYCEKEEEELNSFSQFREETGTWEWKPGFQILPYPEEYADIPLLEKRKHVKMQSHCHFSTNLRASGSDSTAWEKSQHTYIILKVKPTNHTKKYLAIIIKDTFLTSDFLISSTVL